MAGDYISREAAIDYIKANQCRKCSDIGLCGKCAVLTAIKLFEAIPAADVVEVVRCRECEFWERDRITCEGVARCRTGESGVRFRSGHDYCSLGILKRKDGEMSDESGVVI